MQLPFDISYFVAYHCFFASNAQINLFFVDLVVFDVMINEAKVKIANEEKQCEAK